MQATAAAAGVSLPLGDFLPPWSGPGRPAVVNIPFRQFAESLRAAQAAAS